VLLLLQFSGWDGMRPSFALIPQPRPKPCRKPCHKRERVVLPLALQFRRQVQAQLDFLARSPSRPAIDPASPATPPATSDDSAQPSRSGTDLLYALMSLQC
jgi:hypothetical protein